MARSSVDERVAVLYLNTDHKGEFNEHRDDIVAGLHALGYNRFEIRSPTRDEPSPTLELVRDGSPPQVYKGVSSVKKVLGLYGH